MDPLPLLLYILVFPGIAFLIGYSFFMKYVDRKVAARMQHRVGPPFFQPFADFVKTLGKEVINLKGMDLSDPELAEYAARVRAEADTAFAAARAGAAAVQAVLEQGLDAR